MEKIISMEKVYAELVAMRKEIDIIKSRVMELEVVMTSDEEEMLENTLDLHTRRKTKKLEDLKREIGD